MFKITPTSLMHQNAIGAAPGSYVPVSSLNRNHIREWLMTQGISSLAVGKALDSSLSKAYLNEKYLAAWRMRDNARYGATPDNVPEAQIDLDRLDDGSDPIKPPVLDEPKVSSPPLSSNMQDVAATLAQVIESKLNIPARIKTEVGSQVLKGLVEVTKTLDEKIATQLSKVEIDLNPKAKEQIKALARDEGRKIFDEWLPPKRIEIVVNGVDFGEIDLQHERFPDLLRACAARGINGSGLNVWLTGPTGSGKTFAAEQVAKMTKRTFFCDSSLDADYKVLGFRDAHGTFQETPFYKAYSSGGVYCLDEVDNWSPSALLSVNAGLASGFQTFANGEMIRRHPDLTIIACANTWGLGATNEYVGRTKLDAATLDRFFPKIDWQIDERLEMEISRRCSRVDWCEMVQNARRTAKTQGLKIIISPRATYNGIALLVAGFSWNEVVGMTVTAGLSPEQRQALGGLTGGLTP